MGILDTIVDDPTPINVNLNFLDYAFGAKLSTKAREYFVKYGDSVYGAKTLEEYFAQLLFKELKQKLKDELQESIELNKKTAEDQIVSGAAPVAQDIENLKLVKL